MTFMDPIRVDGLAQLRKSLKDSETGSPTMVRLALNDAAQIVVSVAKPRIPRDSGTAAGTLKAASTATKSQIKVGGTKAPYYPWLDFGGSTGKHKSVHRPFLRSGRYIYPAYSQERLNIMKLLEKRLTQVVTDAGLEVT